MNEVKAHGFYYMAPLLMDVATMDMYLLDNVSMRIRLEFATDKFVINTTPGTSTQSSGENRYLQASSYYVET